MMLSIRTACPGLRVISRARPLRLLSRPSTATRSATGVVPGASWSAIGLTGSAFGSPSAALSPASPPHPAASRAQAKAETAMVDFRRVTQSGVQA